MNFEQWWYTLPLRLRLRFRRRQVDEELKDELRDHLDGIDAVALGLAHPLALLVENGAVDVDGVERRLSHKFQSGEDHARHPARERHYRRRAPRTACP